MVQLFLVYKIYVLYCQGPFLLVCLMCYIQETLYFFTVPIKKDIIITCSATCEVGSRQRKRNCILPMHDGDHCHGANTETESCPEPNSIQLCPGIY